MVASVVAGNDCGVSPDVDLIVVKADYFNFDEMLIADGIDFIKKQAIARQQPYILCLCYLPKGGAKDGETGTLARVLNFELGEALGGGLLKGIVAAAGNENYDPDNPCREENNRMHVHKSGTDSFQLEISTTENELHDDLAIMEIWYPVDFGYQIKLTSPTGHVYGPVSPDDRLFRVLGPDGYITISNNRRNMPKWGAIKMVLRDPDSSMSFVYDLKPLSPGNWTVEMIGEKGVWHAYVTYLEPQSLTKAIDARDATNEFKIRSGGNVPGVITVGSVDNGITSWVTLDGYIIDFSKCHDEGKISHFSSMGPSKAGVQKPEIYAEGAWVRVAVSQDTDPAILKANSHKLLSEDEGYAREEGTSFAAPRVAGAIALMVEADADGSLSHDRIKYLLINSAKRRHQDNQPEYITLDIEKAVKQSLRY